MASTRSAIAERDPYALGHDPHRRVAGQGEGGPAPKRIVVAYGFWIFLLSDVIMFAAFFAAYAVLQTGTAGGPRAADLFNLNLTALQTAALLASSFSCGLAGLALDARRVFRFHAWMLVTFVFGAAFLALELYEFAELVREGAAPTRSAFLSAFFALVGLHGLHVAAGLLWLLTMMAQVWAKGMRDYVIRRFLCFSLFWHTLDIIWVAIFTVVYLMGVLR